MDEATIIELHQRKNVIDEVIVRLIVSLYQMHHVIVN